MSLRPLSLIMAAMLGVCASASTHAQSMDRYSDRYNDLFVVKEQLIENRVVLGGTVIPSRQVNIAAQLPGQVEFIAGAEGSAFKEGDLLLTLDDDELLAKRRAAVAQMQNADAALRNAGVQFTRELVNPWSQNQMPGMGMPSMFDSFFTRPFSSMVGNNTPGIDRSANLVARQTGIDQARSSHMQAQSAVEEIDAKLKDAKAHAPFAGVITHKLVEVGDTVQPGMPLLRFADTEYLQVQVEVPSRLMPGVREGLSVPVRLDVGDALVPARVTQIFPMADPTRHTVKVKFDLPQSAPAAPGMYAEVMIADANTPAETLPVIPVSAIVRRGSLPAVFVITERGDTELRLVRLGERVDVGFVSVLSGVRSGERVIRQPKPGMTSNPG